VDGVNREYRVPALALVQRKLPASAQSRHQPARRPEAAASSAWPTVGWVSLGVGVAVLGASGYAGYSAYRSNQESYDECSADDRNLCTKRGLELRRRAGQWADLSTIGAGAGAAVAITGLILILSTGSDSDEPEVDQGKFSLSRVALGIDADPATRAGGVSLRGSF
jgi:hypothetical protein